MQDARKLKDEAAEAAARGRYRKAADVYRELALLEQEDPLWPHRAGEALKRAGDREGAIEQLSIAADGYARHGFLLKAISVAKMILEIDPARGEAQSMLASLYASRESSSLTARAGAPPALRLRRPTPTGPVPLVPPPAPPDSGEEDEPAVVAAVPRPPGPPDGVHYASLADESPIRIELVDESSIPFPAAEEIPIAATLPALDEVPSPAPCAPEPAAGSPGPPPIGIPGAALPPTALPRPPSAHAAPPPVPRQVRRPPSIDRLPLNEVIPGARVTSDFALNAFEIPLPVEPTPAAGSGVPALPSIPLFSSLDEQRLRALIERSRIVVRAPGESVVRQGDAGDALYVIVRGEVDVTVEGAPDAVAHLGEGAFFGELALLTEQPRVATVTAVDEVELLEIGRDLVWELIEDAPEVLQILLRFFRDRLIDLLIASSPMFAPFSGPESRELAERFQFLEFKPGTTLAREGERVEGLFALLCGSCDVTTRQAGSIATLGAGALCGLASLLTHRPATATVTTRGRVWALGLPRAMFQELILTHPQILIYVNEVVEARTAELNRRLGLI